MINVFWHCILEVLDKYCNLMFTFSMSMTFTFKVSFLVGLGAFAHAVGLLKPLKEHLLITNVFVYALNSIYFIVSTGF
jgi:hypothetical protein